MRQEIREELNKNKNTELETVVDLKHLVISLIIMVIIFLGVIYIYYFLFFYKSVNKLVKEQYREWNISKNVQILDKQNATKNANAQELDRLRQELLSKNFFQGTRNYYIEIPIEPIGKANPFIENSSRPQNTLEMNKNTDENEDEESFDEKNIPKL